LKERFGRKNQKVERMLAIYNESTGDDEVENLLNNLAEENPLHNQAKKRKIAFLRGENKKAEAVTELNRYLESNMSDKEAWLELADIYMESLDH